MKRITLASIILIAGCTGESPTPDTLTATVTPTPVVTTQVLEPPAPAPTVEGVTKEGLQGPPGEKGDKGDKGDQGPPGRDGVDGKDGESVSLAVVKHSYTFTQADVYDDPAYQFYVGTTVTCPDGLAAINYEAKAEYGDSLKRNFTSIGLGNPSIRVIMVDRIGHSYFYPPDGVGGTVDIEATVICAKVQP